MRNKIFIVLLMVASCVVSAQTTGDYLIFGGNEYVTPPLLPAEETWIELTLIIKDIEQNLIGNKHILLEIENKKENKKENTLRYSNEDGRITLNLKPGDFWLTAKLDDFTTPGKDYVSAEFNILLDNSTTTDLLMFPVGSIKGNVYNKAGERIVDAKIKIDCGRDYGDKNTVSDDFGSFSFEYVPAATCEVSALSDGKVGATLVNVSCGELKTADIILGQEIKDNRFNFMLPLIGVFVLIVAASVFYLSNKNKKTPSTEEKDKIKVTARMQDIIQTLTSRENDIVDLLIKNNGRLTQAEIRHFLKIPKATISRDIRTIEQKKIIETIKIGRSKDVLLTEWFLDKKR